MDAMMEIFFEESSELMIELKSTVNRNIEFGEYDKEYIADVFRVVHTIKADATMMLFDEIAAVSKKVENLLQCIRNTKEQKIVNRKMFDDIMKTYLDYVWESLERLRQDEELEPAPDTLFVSIERYISGMGASDEEIASVCEAVEKAKGIRQVYYIPGAATKDKNKYSSDKDNGVVLIKQKEMTSLDNIISHYSMIMDKYKDLYEGDDMTVGAADMSELISLESRMVELWVRCTKGDFTPVAKKMELLVEEMAASLKKNVRLIVSGEKTKVEKAKRDKISGALIHIIRNAVDHGIEDETQREIMGKPPIGVIRLDFISEDNHIIIRVEDDGFGLDKKKILRTAGKKKMLTKEPSEYTDDEIINLLMQSGMSTTDVPNDYSGRGVGMDVINHNVKELGGHLSITSEEGYGTTVTMEF